MAARRYQVSSSVVRLGVLDVGSNTVHLLVVDAHRGGHPTPMHSEKSVLRLAERITPEGELTDDGADELVRAIESANASAAKLDCAEVIAFATSAVREAGNCAEVIADVAERTGVELRVFSGSHEARLTFLAARRWFGWSAGRMLMLDIGGGSLEVAMGIDEEPALAESLPLGAGRVTRGHFACDPPTRSELVATSAWLEDQLTDLTERVGQAGRPDRVVATSKTFRSLALLTGSAPAAAGPGVPRRLTYAALRQLLSFISRMSSADLAELDGVSPSRAHQLAAGALVAQATMRALSLTELEICPWALREGVILRRLDLSSSADQTAPDTISEPLVTNGSSQEGTADSGALDLNTPQRAR